MATLEVPCLTVEYQGSSFFNDLINFYFHLIFLISFFSRFALQVC